MIEDNMIPVFGILFGVGGPLAIVIVWLALNYRRRRRLMELHHAERMAAIERGMDVPALPIDVIDDRGPRRRRSSLLPGLVWFFVGFALCVGGKVSHGDEDMIVFGLIPLSIGLAYLIYYFVEGRKLEARLLEQDLADRAAGATNGRSHALSADLGEKRL
jgi:hypothetical protein